MTSALKETSVRKPGGSIFLPDSNAIAKEESFVAQDAVAGKDQFDESMNVSQEVSRALMDGLDGTLLLILSSIENNKRLNKSNQRFKKLEGNKLLAYCGYDDKGDFFELGADAHFRLRAREVLDEIKLKRRKEVPNETSNVVEAQTGSTPGLPWLVGKASGPGEGVQNNRDNILVPIEAPGTTDESIE